MLRQRFNLRHDHAFERLMHIPASDLQPGRVVKLNVHTKPDTVRPDRGVIGDCILNIYTKLHRRGRGGREQLRMIHRRTGNSNVKLPVTLTNPREMGWKIRVLFRRASVAVEFE